MEKEEKNLKLNFHAIAGKLSVDWTKYHTYYHRFHSMIYRHRILLDELQGVSHAQIY